MTFERFFTNRNSGAKAPSHSIPMPPRNLARPARWIAPGETIEVLEYIIRGGMLYVGTGMKDPNGIPEPSLINPICAVQATYGSYSTRTLDYWPNYSAIAPEARGAYLGWLASGRSHPKADIGFVFMYFYGLERRAFIDSHGDTAAQDEWPALIEEVQRLLAIYERHQSFAERATQFIEMLRAAKFAKNLIIGQKQPASALNGVPFELKLEIGHLALARTPMPAVTALAWADSDHTLMRGASLNRRPKGFRPLFLHRYAETYPDGLTLPISRAKLMMRYEPASQAVSGFGDIGLYCDDVPDVTTEDSVSTKIQQLIVRCVEELAPYGRFISRYPEFLDTVEAQVLLPDFLWPDFLKNSLGLWKERARTGPCLTSPAALMESFGISGTTTKDLLPVLDALTSVHIGVEPELIGKLPKLDEPIVLFIRDSEDHPARTNLPYVAARVTLQLAHFVALSDGLEYPLAVQYIAEQVAGWVHLAPAHRARLAAYSCYLPAAPVPLSTLRKNIEGLEPLARSAIAKFLCRVAQLGQDASPATVKVLAKLYKMFELDSARLHSDLHAAASGKSGARAQGAGATPLLDVARIAALQKDTEYVSALLSSIFVEDGELAPALVPELVAVGVEPASAPLSETLARESASSPTLGLLGLDVAHTALLRILSTQTSWSRPELQAHAGALGLMLDGALEQINDAAFDAFDMPFVEGEDPFEINPDLPKDFF